MLLLCCVGLTHCSGEEEDRPPLLGGTDPKGNVDAPGANSGEDAEQSDSSGGATGGIGPSASGGTSNAAQGNNVGGLGGTGVGGNFGAGGVFGPGGAFGAGGTFGPGGRAGAFGLPVGGAAGVDGFGAGASGFFGVAGALPFPQGGASTPN